MTMEVGHESTADGEVNAPSKVTLYDAAGHAFDVPEGDVDHWIQQLGASRSSVDPREAAAELRTLGGAAMDAIDAVVEAVEQDEEIDTSDESAMATAERAISEFVAAGYRVIRAIHAKYPVQQGEGVAMKTDAGVDTAVDPGQVAEYEAQGWTRR